MPTTSNGDTVYATPAQAEEYVQVDPNSFSLADIGETSAWREFIESIQARMKERIDEFCNRDFENHTGDTVTFNGGASEKRILHLPTPVQSVSEVRSDGETVPTDEYVVDLEDGLLIRTEPPKEDAVDFLARLEIPRNRREPHWELGYQNIEVDLDWGYSDPPGDIVEAELKLVNNTIQGLAQMREGLIVQQDDLDVSVNLPSAMTPEIRALLGDHRSRGRMAGVL